MSSKRGDNVITENRRARFNYELLEFYEGGLELLGAEVKSIRGGGGGINEAYASFSRGELWLVGSYIAPYKFAGHSAFETYDERRSRKILMHKSELQKLQKAREQQGLTLVPTMLVWRKGRVKVVVAIGRGKKIVDKRETIKKRDIERTLGRLRR